MNVPNGKYVIVGSVAVNGERNLDNRMEELLSICRVVRAYPVLITEKRKYPSKGMTCVCMNELSEMRTPEDLIASV